ncbi:MAG: methanol utilization protein MoxY [Gammaproteobacteria bacterium]|nr:methanol utilization protein MoxY [Gammaproteobacteria bacterium]MCP5202002.1 methanol utilization protein MoxY [Gammaproteobacteria bacterium]
MGLRLRLNLWLAGIFSLALALAVAALVHGARRAVVDEVRASAEFASSLVRGLAERAAPARDHGALVALVAEVGMHAPLRHLRIAILGADGELLGGTVHRGARHAAPRWFERLVWPAAEALTQDIPMDAGRIRIDADPAAEIGEAWREVRVALFILVAAFAGAMAVAFVFLGRALGPLQRLSAGLEGVEHGRYHERLPPSGIPDIDAIIARFNDMAGALGRAERDNAALAQRAIAIQEEERRYLAHELHDELGQSITAIKALAVSIGERADAELAARAATITEVSSDIYARVRDMMTRLHPVVLDELGLVAALGLMIDDWNARHEDCFCENVCPRTLPAFDADARIAVYRVVQEALTNVARHAAASAVRVVLELDQDGDGASTLHLAISDNGIGFDPDRVRRGLGLRGIGERVTALNGSWSLTSRPQDGTRIEVRVPLAGNLVRSSEA